MSSLQDWVYNAEDGPLRAWLVRIALFLLVAGFSAWLGIREFNGLRTPEAMDLAQQARQITEGKGMTTLFIRPLALWQVRANLGKDAPPVTDFPQTLNPPLYPLILAASFKVGELARVISFTLSPDSLKSFRIYPPDVLILIGQLVFVLCSSFFVYAWAQRQFDMGTAVLAVVFFLGSSPLWTEAVSGGATLLTVLIFALAGWLLCLGLCQQEDDEAGGTGGRFGFWLLAGGFVLGLAALVQMIQVWSALAAGALAWVVLRKGKMAVTLGLGLALALFVGWLVHLWLVSGNPLGLNWAYLLADSPRFPGETVWRTYSLDVEKTDMWRRVGGSMLRGLTSLVSQGPALCGNAVAGVLALVAGLHSFRRFSATAGRNLWAGIAGVLLLATAFIQRSGEGGDPAGHPILLVLLPASCVYGAAYLWILVERWKLHLELLRNLFVTLVAMLSFWPTFARMVLPEPAPFAFPPTYPPIFLFMRDWFQVGELQASDLPSAEAWYSAQPTLWLPTTREDFLKIHDRVAPVFSILLTPASSDVRMYSQMMGENAEWKAWADLIRRQKPPDLPQAFATSLPPNNDYLLLSVQKRWK